MKRRKMARRYNNLGEQVIRKEKYNNLGQPMFEKPKKRKKKDKIEVCSTCQCEFDLDAEGGTKGEFGIIPVAFCPTCLSSVFDMVEKLK